MRTDPVERDIQQAIRQAFWMMHRIRLMPIDAGGVGMRSAGSSHVGATGIPPGFPDLLGIIPASGRAIFVEVKRQGQKPRVNQVEFLAWANRQNAVAFWASSVDDALRQFNEQMKGAGG